MEIVTTLSKREYLEKYISAGTNGILLGSAFSLRFSYTLDELKDILEYCYRRNIKRYISIDALICEDDRALLYEYLEVLNKLNIDGIYFSDLGIINAAKKIGIESKLIYDPDTLITNSLDAKFFIKQDIGVVLARELSFEEVEKIVINNANACDMQIFGHLRMSYSKRQFLTNYFKHIGSHHNLEGRRDLRLVEETRNYKLPVIEDDFGTRIYTDYCLLMYKQLVELREYIKRGIIDDTFVSGSVIVDVIKDIKRINEFNAEFLEKTLIENYSEIVFSNDYLNNKTTKTKEENEED